MLESETKQCKIANSEGCPFEHLIYFFVLNNSFCLHKYYNCTTAFLE